MQLDRKSRRAYLHAQSERYLALALANITREFPAYPWYIATKPGPYPIHREAHPVFYGSFDWHSCVEMYWVAIRLLRLFPENPLANQTIAQLDTLITANGMEREHAFFLDPNLKGFERPYGWGWYLALVAETANLDHPAAHRWLEHLRPLAHTIESAFVAWLPKLTWPQRMGMHPNTAFALVLARPWAEQRALAGDATVLLSIDLTAHRFFLHDTDYPAHYEPSGADFLSAALTEAVLMQYILDPEEFRPWFDQFLPGLPHEPQSILTPVTISDPTDGQIAHLHGLNLSRAWGWMNLAASLPENDIRKTPLIASAERHAAGSLPSVAGGDYMVEHWLLAYAVLLLTFDE